MLINAGHSARNAEYQEKLKPVINDILASSDWQHRPPDVDSQATASHD